MSSRDPESGTFVFADLAGYTALTEAHGDADAAELAATFCGAISEVAASSGGEVIKTEAVNPSSPTGSATRERILGAARRLLAETAWA